MTCISKTRADAAKLMPDSESASLKTPKTILISPATKNFFDFVGQCYLTGIILFQTPSHRCLFVRNGQWLIVDFENLL